MAARSITLPPDPCRRASRMTRARISSSFMQRHLDVALGPHDPRLARRDPMARVFELVRGLILARRSLRRLGAIDEVALALSRLVELLDRLRVSLFAATRRFW